MTFTVMISFACMVASSFIGIEIFDDICARFDTPLRFTGLNRYKGGTEGGQIAKSRIYRRHPSRDEAAAGVIDRAGDVIDAKLRRLDQGPQLARRSEFRRVHIFAPNHPRRRLDADQRLHLPRSPMMSRPPGLRTRAISRTTETGSGTKASTVITVTRSKLRSRNGSVSARADRVADRRLVLRGVSGGMSDHARIDVTADDRGRTTLPACQGQCAIAAADIQHSSALQFAGQAQDQPPLDDLGDDSERARAPACIDFGLKLAGMVGCAAAETQNADDRCQPAIGQAFETVIVITTSPPPAAFANASARSAKIRSSSPTGDRSGPPSRTPRSRPRRSCLRPPRQPGLAIASPSRGRSFDASQCCADGRE